MVSSLHSLAEEEGPNAYMQAIRAIGDILDQYDSDKKYPFYGFGGIPSFAEDQATVSDCFPLSGDVENPEIEGIDAVLERYTETAKDTAMMGPTRFTDILRQAKNIATNHPDPKMYNILLILTDGEIHDLKETIEEISDIASNNVPLSIIIVGLGDDEFTNMVKLDGDEIAIKAGV
jgi:hypothetical protein